MKRIFMLLIMVSTLVAYSQNSDEKTLSTINTVKPKAGQKMAFEAKYKQHVEKFHKTEEKITVYEILSGEYAGYYHLVNAEKSFADFDKERADAAAHNLDLDKNFYPLLENTINGTYRFIDSMSQRPNVQAEKFYVTVDYLKQPVNQAEYRREQARTVKINSKIEIPYIQNLNYLYFEQLWEGSIQVTVNMRILKDGFKSLPFNYYGRSPAGTPLLSVAFKDEYTKEYGSKAWDDRVKLLEGAIEKTQQYIMRLRKDLSTY